LQYIASMPFKDVITTQTHSLSDSDQQIVQALLADPRMTAFLSAAEVAEKVGVHESTVVRLAKKLGYGGYKELRQDLHEEIAPAERVRRRLASTTELATLVNQEISTLQTLVNTVAQEQLDQAARILIESRRIFLFGQGHATALMDYMDRRLRRSGFDTVLVSGQGREVAEQVLTLGSQDTLLSFIFRVQTRGLNPLLNRVKQTRARHVMIGDNAAFLIRPQPAVLLASSRGADDQFLTLTVPMVLCNALILTIARLDGGRSMHHLDQLSALIHLFEHEEHD
jgi:DNA-binding MurR/RpiR family transcriptional regulator